MSTGQTADRLRGLECRLYLWVMVIGLTTAAYAQYSWQYFASWIPVFMGQSPGIWLGALTIAAAAATWLLAPWGKIPLGWPLVFYLGLGGIWAARLLLARVHGDAFDYTVWFIPIILLLLATKFPSAADLVSTLNVVGWSIAVLLVWTRLSELLDIAPMVQVPADILEFERREYWLPFSGWLGPEGRWPGPAGGTAFTGMLGAILIVLSVAVWRRSSPILGLVGLVTLLLTSSRGSFVAAAAGIGIVVMFSNNALTERISLRLRVIGAFIGAACVVALVLRASPGLTGRTTFWPQFLELWQSSPWMGVGASGYQKGTHWTNTAGSAHSLYIDELARNGLIGFLLLVLIVVAGVVTTTRVLPKFVAGPGALFGTVLILGIANTPITWIGPSLVWLAALLAVSWAAAAEGPVDPPELGSNEA